LWPAALGPAVFAVCTPATGDNITVSWIGTTTDQAPGINTGYGASNQHCITTVTGALPTKSPALASARAELRLPSGGPFAGKFDSDFAGRADT
jgi:hypothetical protein